MNKILYSFLLSICLIVGIIFHAYQKEWIILLLPHQTTDSPLLNHNEETTYIPKKIALFFFKHGKWHTEHNVIIWSCDVVENVKTTTQNWLMLLEDEKIIDTDMQLASAVITSNKELFLSFNKDLFEKQSATFDKLMIIESLLKTLQETKLPIQSVRFLIHHQTMIDDHLNFAISWPIAGYMHTT